LEKPSVCLGLQSIDFTLFLQQKVLLLALSQLAFEMYTLFQLLASKFS